MNACRVWCAAVLLVGVSACHHRPVKEERAGTSASAASNAPAPTLAEAPILARSSDSSVEALPEDPEAGARSVAEWREHLREEERERRLSYDRHRERQHREVIQRLREIRRRYAVASNERAIRSVQAQLSTATPQLEQKFDAIDHWRVSSTLVPEYAKLVEIFSKQYPEARIAALSGEKAVLAAIDGEIAARFERIEEELHEALESEDE